MIIKNDWAIVYKKAIQDDGSLLFPERLTKEFLDQARRTMGSNLFANQYQNEVIPADKQTFKKHWIKNYQALPEKFLTFGFINPAISEADTADFTGIVIVSVDTAQNWYVRHAVRLKLNPSEIIEECFKLCDKFKITTLGIEDVAFQRAILHFAHEEMKRRNKRIPITGVKRGTDKTKEMRILSLVPRFEWGTIFLNAGLNDLELELAKFPRGRHDDIIDSLASLEEIVHYPQIERKKNVIQHQTIQDTKAGTSVSSTKEAKKTEKNNGPTRNELNEFSDDIASAIANNEGKNMPEIQAKRVVIEYFNKGHIEGFDSTGYFVFQGVKVFEEGKVETAKKQDALTMEQINFGKK